FQFQPRRLSIQPNGKFVFSGESLGAGIAMLQRRNADGVIDTSFGNAGTATLPFRHGYPGTSSGVHAVDSSGRILVGVGTLAGGALARVDTSEPIMPTNADFTRDGKPDLMIYQGANLTRVLRMNGPQIEDDRFASLFLPPPWLPIGQADFDGDGQIDLLW